MTLRVTPTSYRTEFARARDSALNGVFRPQVQMERLPAASLAARVAAFSPTSPLVVSVTEALACVPFKLST